MSVAVLTDMAFSSWNFPDVRELRTRSESG
jgi:hypothetical protein